MPDVHDHGYDPSCREFSVGGMKIGECRLAGDSRPARPTTADGLLMIWCNKCSDWARPDVPCPTVSAKRTPDPVSSPDHYTWLPVEAIEITELFSFTLGNALKYILRADHKGKPVEDLLKARWYLSRELARRGHVDD